MLQLILNRTSLACFLLVSCCTIGCGGAPEKRYVPAADTARKALEAGLNQWKSGEAHGPVKGLSVTINVFDARWQGKKKLESFEILREEKSDGPRTFIVKMKLDEDKEEKEVKYLVVGKDPLHIFREQDYNKAGGTGG